MKLNMHLHSQHSDGRLTVDQIVDLLAKAETEVAALTDHDTTAGLPHFFALAERHNIKAFSGIEISVPLSHCPLPFLDASCAFHLLAFGFDLDAFDELWAAYRLKRNEAIADLVSDLRAKGLSISPAELPAHHLFWTILDVAYILLSRGYASSIDDALVRLIGVEDKSKAFHSSPREIIALIHKAGGVAILAHPFDVFETFYKKRLNPGEVDRLVAYLVAQGLDGIESYYQPFFEELNEHSHRLAMEYNLLESYGTDFHGRGSLEAISAIAEGESKIVKHLKSKGRFPPR